MCYFQCENNKQLLVTSSIASSIQNLNETWNSMTKTNENIINRNLNVFDIESLVRQDFFIIFTQVLCTCKNIKKIPFHSWNKFYNIFNIKTLNILYLYDLPVFVTGLFLSNEHWGGGGKPSLYHNYVINHFFQ